MRLAECIETNKERLVDRWKHLVVDRLSMTLDDSQLVDHIPDFIDELVVALKNPGEQWPAPDSARDHGRSRMRLGIDMGALTEEMVLIIEAVCELGLEDHQVPTFEEVRTLARVVGHGCSASINAYTALRDSELADASHRHFSFIAHELRTPLQSAVMALEVVRSGRADVRERYIEHAERSLEEMSTLIDQALVEVRLASSPLTDFEPLDAAELVDDAVRTIELHAMARDLSLELDVEPFRLDGDRKLLNSSLTNLLKNAVKFSEPGTSIVVRANANGARANFIVEDGCGGMPEDMPEHLFKPYLQYHEDRSGLGLGLVIVKQAVEAHQGAVRVVSRSGDGCSFVLELPLTQGTEADAATPSGTG